MSSIVLKDEYIARKVEAEEFNEMFREYRSTMFQNSVDFRPMEIITDNEREKLKQIFPAMKYPNTIHYLIEKDNELAGWSYGFQDGKEEFYMCNSGIFPKHRRQGLYSKILKVIMDEAIAKGFQIIHSKHALTNNAVIIPKLKAGFIISGIAMEDKFGTMLNLSYYVNKDRQAVMRFRSGEEALPEKLAKYGNLTIDKT